MTNPSQPPTGPLKQSKSVSYAPVKSFVYSGVILTTAILLLYLMCLWFEAANISNPQPVLALLSLVFLGVTMFGGIIAALLAVSNCFFFASLFAHYDLVVGQALRMLVRRDFGISRYSRCALAIEAIYDGRMIDAEELLGGPPYASDAEEVSYPMTLETGLLAHIYTCTGRKDRALSFLEKSQQLAEQEYEADPSELNAKALAEVDTNIGSLLDIIGEHERGFRVLARGLELRERFCGSESEQVAKTLNNLGVLQQSAGDLLAAEKTLRRAMAILEKIGKASGCALGYVLNTLASVLIDLGRPEEAVELSRRALRLGQLDRHERALRTFTMGKCLEQLNRAKEALKYYKRALQQWSKMQAFKHPAFDECERRFAVLCTKKSLARR